VFFDRRAVPPLLLSVLPYYLSHSIQALLPAGASGDRTMNPRDIFEYLTRNGPRWA
jgi:hypothetical protein